MRARARRSCLAGHLTASAILLDAKLECLCPLNRLSAAPARDARGGDRDARSILGEDAPELDGLRERRSGEFTSERVELHLGERAARERLAGDLRGYSVLHLACHGFVDSEEPQRSGIALAASADDDGFFTIADALELDLDCDLVVLSACPTARGEIKAGEGVESIARAFLTEQFKRILDDAGVEVILTPKRAPNCNAFAERFVLSIKSECLDRMIFFGERRLREAVTSYLEHYHLEREHQGLGNERIEPATRGHGEVVCDERLGGLLKCYRRVA